MRIKFEPGPKEADGSRSWFGWYILSIKNQNLILPNRLIIFHHFVISGWIDRDRKYNKIKSHDYFFNNFDISSIAVTLLWTS